MSDVQTLTFNQPTDSGGTSRRTFMLPSASSGLPSQSSAASLIRSASIDTDDDNIFTDGDNKQSVVTRPPCISSSSVNLRRISLSSSTPVLPYTSPMQRRNSFSFSPSSSFDLGGSGSGSLQRSHVLMRSTTTLDSVDGAARREASAMEQLERQRRDEISRRLKELRATAPPPASGRRLRQASVEDPPAPTSTQSNQDTPTAAVVKPTLGMPTIVRAPVRGLQPSMSAFQLRTRRDVLGSQSSATSAPGSSPGVGPMRASWTIDAAARTTGGRLSTSDIPDDRTSAKFSSTDSDSLRRMVDAQPRATFQVAKADNDGDDNEQLVPSRRPKRDVKHDVNNNLDPLGKDNNYCCNGSKSDSEKPTADNLTSSEIRLKVDTSSENQKKFATNCEQSMADVDQCQQNGLGVESVSLPNKDSDAVHAKNKKQMEIDALDKSTPTRAAPEFVDKQPEKSMNEDRQTGASAEPTSDSAEKRISFRINNDNAVKENEETCNKSVAVRHHQEKENEPAIAAATVTQPTSSANDRPTMTDADLQKQQPRDSFFSTSTLFLTPHPPTPTQTAGNRSPVAPSTGETACSRKGRKLATTEDGKLVVGRIKSLLERVELDDVVGEASGSDIEDVVKENEKYVAAAGGSSDELVLEDQSHQYRRREAEREALICAQPDVKPETQRNTNCQNMIDFGAFDDEPRRTTNDESIHVSPIPEKKVTTEVPTATSDVGNLLDLVQFDDDPDPKSSTSLSTFVPPETDDSHRAKLSDADMSSQFPDKVSTDNKLRLQKSNVTDIENGYKEETIIPPPSSPPSSPAPRVTASPPALPPLSGHPLDCPILTPTPQNDHQTLVGNMKHESETAASSEVVNPGSLITITIDANDNDRSTEAAVNSDKADHLSIFEAESDHPGGANVPVSPDVITKRVEVPDTNAATSTTAAAATATTTTVVNGDDVPTAKKFMTETVLNSGNETTLHQFSPQSPTVIDTKTRSSFYRNEDSNVKTNGEIPEQHSSRTTTTDIDVNRSSTVDSSSRQPTGSSIDNRNERPAAAGSSNDSAGRASSSSTSCSHLIDLVLNKDCVGLGFCIEGGTDYSGRRTPVTIKRLFKGETWAKGHLEAGDELIQVNGVNLDGMSHNQAWTQLKTLPDGIVTMRIRRKVARV